MSFPWITHFHFLKLFFALTQINLQFNWVTKSAKKKSKVVTSVYLSTSKKCKAYKRVQGVLSVLSFFLTLAKVQRKSIMSDFFLYTILIFWTPQEKCIKKYDVNAQKECNKSQSQESPNENLWQRKNEKRSDDRRQEGRVATYLV